MTKEELEKEAKEWIKDHSGLIGSYEFVKYDYDSMQKAYLAGAEPREKRIEELKKENAELDCQKNRNKFCYSCANATERCFRNEIGCPCEKYKSYKEENAELREELSYANSHCLFHSDCPTQKENAELKSACDKTQELLDKQIEATHKLDVENAELRKDCIESEEDNNKLRENIQKLAVAKDLIERLILILVLSNTPYERYTEVQEEAEQFLNSEVEK